MTEIIVYSFEKDGQVWGSFLTRDWRQAEEYARKARLSVIANKYTWSDSELVKSFE